ncbi:AAA family ATPase [Telmatocola sphagniphila]|uniref:AAA family ATPase n=1 Tax=Telmatocola sphagniphila TaxID=1123043 RepID=A0A8E6BAN0_9BACT|nr:DnaB-like helicase C-terminal domain-containing protein [Telmatocola sphagniphila]QVL34221.1 AAA family ATPase [Telmatocola sphagniphila]
MKSFFTAGDLFEDWRDEIESGKPPTLYRCGTGDFEKIELGPGRVMLIGGAPGAGKTAFVMQCVVDALRIDPTLRACVLNVEMAPGVLLDRQLARLSGVDATLIRQRKLETIHADRIDQAFSTLESIGERLAFVRPPYSLENLANAADEFESGLLVLDYIQRIEAPGDHADNRGSVNASMNFLRQFADNGQAVIVVSAVGRTKDSKGRSSYSGEGLNLASFRESSELEFGCDDAYILVPIDEDTVKLGHHKSRHGEQRDISLSFAKSIQRFTPESAPSIPGSKPRTPIESLWNRPKPAKGSV